jgi:serine acetyltransferase
MSFTLPWTTNRFITTYINNTNSYAGTYKSVSLAVDGNTQLTDTTVSRLGVNKNTNASYEVDVNGGINVSGSYSIGGVPLNLATPSFTIITASSTPYSLLYSQLNVFFVGGTNQTVILPAVTSSDLGQMFTIIRSNATQMIVQAPTGFTFYNENNDPQSAQTFFSANRILQFTAINTNATYPMWAMTYSQSPNQNLAVTISNTQNITGTKSFGQVNFNLLPTFIGTLGAIGSTNFITKGIADASYQLIGSYATLGGTNAFTGTNTFNTNLPTSTLTPTTSTQLITKAYADATYHPIGSYATLAGTNTWTGTNTFNTNLPTSTLTPTTSTQLITKAYGDTTYPQLAIANTFANINTFTNQVNINNTFVVNTTGSATFYNTSNPLIGVFTVNLTANTLTCTLLNSTFTKTVGIQTANIDALTVSNTAIFSGALPTYTGTSPTYADNTFFPRSYGDTRYAQLTANNTFSGTTTFTGSIIANGLTITPIELGYLDGVNNGIQGQLNNRVTLTTNQINITGDKTFLGATIINNLLPYFSSTTTSYKMGLNAMQYQQASATYNIAIGENALLGYATTPAWNQTKRNIAIGFNAGKNLYYDSGTVASDDNVIIGYNAGSNMFYSSRQNVLIGSNCGSSNNYIQKCVFIGANIASTGSFFLSDCVIIGANSLQSVSDKSGIVCVGSGNLPVFSGNGPVCVGVNCGTSSLNNNRGIWLGGSCGNNVNSDLGSYFIGNNCGNNLTTGGSCCFMGNDSDTGNGAMVNTFVFGYQANCSTSDTFYVGGVNLFTGKTMDLLIAKKNRILSQNDFTSSGTVNLTFEMGEHINLDTITSVVNLPFVGSNNVGARFIIYRDFTATVCAIISSNAFGLINNTGASATMYNMPAGACYVTLVAIAVQPTSGVPIVCWMVLNQDLNNEVSAISYNTTAITYDGTATSISSPLLLNNGAVDFQDVKATTGTVGTLAVPLSSVYTITGTTTLTLPAITTDIVGVRLTFIKQDTNTLTISRSSTDTFRYPGSATSTTAGPLVMLGNWTILELVAQTAGVWNIVSTNDKMLAVNTTLNTSSFTIAFPFFKVYQIGTHTANITATLPTPVVALVGETFTIRRTSATAPTFSVLSSIAYYPIGSTTTTTTLLNTTTYKITLQCLYLTASTYAWYAV